MNIKYYLEEAIAYSILLLFLPTLVFLALIVSFGNWIEGKPEDSYNDRL